MDAAAAVDAKTRAHRCLENAQNAFPTAPTGVTLAKSGQITCQTEADRSLVNNRPSPKEGEPRVEVAHVHSGVRQRPPAVRDVLDAIADQERAPGGDRDAYAATPMLIKLNRVVARGGTLRSVQASTPPATSTYGITR